MKNYLHELIGDGKEFLSSRINQLFTIVIMFGVFSIGFQFYTLHQIDIKTKRLENAIAENHKRINHRYFCITKTLSDVFNIKINTANGEVKN